MSKLVLLQILMLGVISLHGVTALNCTECDSASGWEHCAKRAKVVQCNTTDVNSFHQGLHQFNAGLPVGDFREFKCFRMKAFFYHPEHSGLAYGQGCTFAGANFCSGWKNVAVLECSLT